MAKSSAHRFAQVAHIIIVGFTNDLQKNKKKSGIFGERKKESFKLRSIPEFFALLITITLPLVI